jgi:hypothetical protein
MQRRPVYKPSFNEIFRNAIASAKIEGIRFDGETKARIKKEAINRLRTGSQ